MFSKFTEVGSSKHSNNIGKTIQYGTAGFRTRYDCNFKIKLHNISKYISNYSGDILDHVMYRMGALAVIRSKKKKGNINNIIFSVLDIIKIILSN